MSVRTLGATLFAAVASAIGYALIKHVRCADQHSGASRSNLGPRQSAIHRWEAEGGAALASPTIHWSERDRRMGPG
jgi:hypothetical protein